MWRLREKSIRSYYSNGNLPSLWQKWNGRPNIAVFCYWISLTRGCVHSRRLSEHIQSSTSESKITFPAMALFALWKDSWTLQEFVLLMDLGLFWQRVFWRYASTSVAVVSWGGNSLICISWFAFWWMTATCCRGTHWCMVSINKENSC